MVVSGTDEVGFTGSSFRLVKGKLLFNAVWCALKEECPMFPSLPIVAENFYILRFREM